MPKKSFSKFTEAILLESKWFSNRRCSEKVKEWIEILQQHNPHFIMFSEAERVLLEYAEIQVNQKGEGIDFAREPFEINSLLALGESDRFSDFEVTIGQKLYPLGEGGASHFFLAIAENGKVYGLMMEIFLIGNTFEEALENLILGLKPKI